MRFDVVALGLSALLILAPAPRQDPKERPTFRSEVDAVALNVVVTDQHKQFVGGLAGRDFAVFEDGVPQTISYFAVERVPLDLAVVIDTSSSMGPIMKTMQTSAIGLVQALQPVDRVTVIGIRTRAEVLHDLDGDLRGAIESIRRSSADGKTALYDSLYIALTQMARSRGTMSEPRRQAIALLSDGQDTASVSSYDSVMELARESFINVYTIALVPRAEEQRAWADSVFPEALFRMKSFAVETGARAFVARGATDLKDIYNAITEDLAHQYTVGYLSTNKRHDGGFRRIEVRVVDRADVTARARTGYLAPR